MKLREWVWISAIIIIGIFTTMVVEMPSSRADQIFEHSNFLKDGSVYKWQQDGKHSLEAIKQVSINTINGKLHIKTHTNPDTTGLTWNVEIHITRGMLFGSDEKMESAKEQTGVVMEEDDGHLRIKAQHPEDKPWGIKNIAIHINVLMPEDVQLNAKTVNGWLRVEGIKAPLAVESVNGQVETINCSGPVKAKSVNGSINTDGLIASISAETVNGSIKSSFNKSPKDQCRFNSVNGSVLVKLPNTAGLNLEFSTLNGAFNYDSNRFEGEKEKRKLKGTYNGGGPLLKTDTVNGSITISHN